MLLGTYDYQILQKVKNKINYKQNIRLKTNINCFGPMTIFFL